MHIAIIGSGFTGTMLAVHLLRRSEARITLLERGPRFAAGVAYSTPFACHLLNVPAGRMSALPDDEEHFLRWAAARDASVNGGTFVPRMLFGQYIADLLNEASDPARLERIRAEALSVEPSGQSTLRVASDVGGGARTIDADAVVLAIGNYPPADPPCKTPEFYASPLYHQDPWVPGVLEPGDHRDVLLLGTGLTMIDAAVALREQGFTGRIHAVSRRGLLPQSHRDISAAPPHIAPPGQWQQWPASATGICRSIRAEVNRAHAAGVDWRDVVTSLRPITCDLWKSLPQPEKRRFLTHLRPFFETHRHRTAPHIGRIIDSMRDSGSLVTLGGRILRFEPRAGGVDALIRPRGRDDTQTIHVARVINCTGPDTDLKRVRDPLVRTLRDRGVIRPDALGLGLDSDEHGRIIDAQGRAHDRLYLAGPLRRGLLWENIAVPELREEAQRLSRTLIERHSEAVSR